jgi:hypothetical protein
MSKFTNFFTRPSAKDDSLAALQNVIAREKNARYIRNHQLLSMDLEKALRSGEVVVPLRLDKIEPTTFEL